MIKKVIPNMLMPVKKNLINHAAILISHYPGISNIYMPLCNTSSIYNAQLKKP